MNNVSHNKICKICLMDYTAADFISYGNNGCSYCTAAIKLHTSNQNKLSLVEIIQQLEDTKGEVKAVVGISGGVDSSYVAHLLDQYGVKALLVHMDNGWNASLGTSNIKRLVNNTIHEFESYVLYWPELREMQRCFFNADVVDIELLYDHASTAVLHYYAKKYKIKNIIDGVNYQTEGIMVPSNWRWYKYDKLHIKHIANDVEHVNFPYFGTLDRIEANLKGFRRISLLDTISYNKTNALAILEKKYGYIKYSGKHEESLFTKFYQDIILPLKFGIDKRKLHLSDLIINKEITREEGLNRLENQVSLEEFLDHDFLILNKLRFTKDQFIKYIQRDPNSHSSFRNEYYYIQQIRKIL